MGSTVRSISRTVGAETPTPAPIRWRSWPLVDNPRSSWMVPLGILLTGAFVWWLGGGPLIGLVAVAALAVAFWQFLLPVSFEITPMGVRRIALGRMRLVPWQAVRAYQLRSSGVFFFQRPDPTTIDLLSSLFVPYPSDEDEVVVAVRLYLGHAVEVP
jgi:hypothetical protein